MSQDKAKKNGNGGENGKAPRRALTIELGLGKATALGVLAIFVVAWAFALGVIIGRGYKPEKAVPEIARIMPTPPPPASEGDTGVLKPEELHYMDSLTKTPVMPPKAAEAVQDSHRAEQQKAAQRAQQKAEQKAEQQKPEPRKTTTPSMVARVEPAPTARKEAPAAQQKAPAPAPKQPQKQAEKQAPQTQAAAEGRFSYIYQVASFTDKTQAEAMVKRVKSTGLWAQTESTEIKGKTWHRVIVQFRGTPDETNEMKSRLGKIGITRVIMRSKSPL
ncbi:Sporulation domain-containing protein [Desulfovibrio sp. X2]|uniref:SPOR domain-containing protein n=1 Tax=Desulfovibrio sp. X2 TaxID=941449 RepID=UPI000358D3E3|nr:SPOR domain-containing protein [Desulfovibrio sp. X2]EPR37520.1 Sporulation domain-containing protein [Desulfovibrio sp. X2]